MTKLFCLATLALTLATPAVSRACRRWGMPRYGYSRGWAVYGYGYGRGWGMPRYGYFPRYYWTWPGSFRYYRTWPGYFRYYRVGNVIINGRRWGNIGRRYSYGDLIRW
jgi:hypothetical protein